MSAGRHTDATGSPSGSPVASTNAAARTFARLAGHQCFRHRLVAADFTALVMRRPSSWNAAYAALYPNVATVAASDRNFLWLLFTDPDLRTTMQDWEFTCLNNVASFRAEAGARLGEPPFSDLVSRLLETSEAFRAAWQSYDIETLPSRERLFRHPEVGDLFMEQHSLMSSGHPRLHLVMFTPIPATDTAIRLRRLLDMQAIRLGVRKINQRRTSP